MSWSNSDGHSNDYLGSSDITDARFSRAEAWTWLLHFRCGDYSGDERCLIAKDSQVYIRIKTGGTITVNFSYEEIETSYTVSTDTWYVLGLSCDGTSGSSDLTLNLWDLSGTLHEDAKTGTHAGDAGDLTGTIRHGSRDEYDEYDGELCHSCYVGAELTQDEQYLFVFDPARAAMGYQADNDVWWYLPMDEKSVATLGVDRSGSGNDFSNNGGGTSVGANSPTGLLWSRELEFPVPASAGGTSLTQPAVDTVELDTFAGTVKANQDVSQGAIGTIDIASFNGTVNVGLSLDQTAIDTVDIAAFSGTVKADQTVAQTAIDTVDVAALSGTVKADQALTQTAIDTVELASFDGTVGAGLSITQTAIDTVELDTFNGSLNVALGLSQTAIDTVDLVTFDGTVTVSGDVDLTQPALALVEIVSFDGSVQAGTFLTQPTVETVEVAAFSGTLWTLEYGEEWLYTAANWLSYEFYFEAYAKVTSGTSVYVAMFNASTLAIVSESVVSTSSASFERVRSAALTTLTDGVGYVVGVGRTGGAEGLIRGAHLVATPG